MNYSSVQLLCQLLISSAIQRCRLLDDLCRLSVVLRSSSLHNPPLLRISISDTGVGSCLEEFQDVKCPRDPNADEIWDGVVSVATTSICDKEIYQYNLNLKESDAARRPTKLPSTPKNGAKFSGTEVSLTIFKSVNELLAEIICFIRKMLILKIPKVAVELVVDCAELPGCQCDKIILANECSPLPAESNIACLKLGLEDYVLKHGNKIENTCHSCFPSGEYLKVGSGVACSRESNRRTEMMMEAVIIFSQSSQPMSPCFRASGTKTEVLHFKDFAPCSVSQSSLNGLTSIDWKKYGLILKNISSQDRCLFLEWENLPPDSHIAIAVHCYQTQVIKPPAKKQTGSERNLIRKAVKLAIDDLKDKNAGVLLSAHTAKGTRLLYALNLFRGFELNPSGRDVVHSWDAITNFYRQCPIPSDNPSEEFQTICSYAPDLARTMAGLILTSNDLNFQQECISLLGVQCQEMETDNVENCIRERIISVIELNDRRPQKSREAAPFLFEDEGLEDPEFMEEGEEVLSSLDL